MLYRNITTPDRPVPFTVLPDEYDRGTRYLKRQPSRNGILYMLISPPTILAVLIMAAVVLEWWPGR